MSFPDLDYLIQLQKQQPTQPVLIEMDAHHKRLFVDRAAYMSLSDTGPNSDRQKYLDNLDAALQANVKSAKNPNGIYTQAQKNKLLNDAREYLQGSVANAYASGDQNGDKIPDSFGFIWIDSKSKAEDFIDWGRNHDLQPLRPFTAVENQMNNFAALEHENAHSMLALAEPGADYISAWETLQKYGPAAIEVLERTADQRILESVLNPIFDNRDGNAREYGYECALAIRQAIENYRNHPGFTQSDAERSAAYNARSSIRDYTVSLYGDGAAGASPSRNALEKPTSMDPLEWARYFDEKNKAHENFFDRLPEDLRQEIDRETLALFRRNKPQSEFKQSLKGFNLPQDYAKYTSAQKSQFLSNYQLWLSPVLRDRLKIAREETDISYPEIAVREKLIALARREDVANQLGLPKEKIFSGQYRLDRLNMNQLRLLMDIAEKEGLFAQGSEDERNAFQMLKQAFENELRHSNPVAEPKPVENTQPVAAATSKSWSDYLNPDAKPRDLFSRFSKSMQTNVNKTLQEALSHYDTWLLLKDHGFPTDFRSYTPMQKIEALTQVLGICTDDVRNRISLEAERALSACPDIVIERTLMGMLEKDDIRKLLGIETSGLIIPYILFGDMTLAQKYGLVQLAESTGAFRNSPPEVQEMFQRVKRDIEKDFNQSSDPALKTSRMMPSASFAVMQG